MSGIGDLLRADPAPLLDELRELRQREATIRAEISLTEAALEMHEKQGHVRRLKKARRGKGYPKKPPMWEIV
jgi:hypothetical protein